MTRPQLNTSGDHTFQVVDEVIGHTHHAPPARTLDLGPGTQNR